MSNSHHIDGESFEFWKTLSEPAMQAGTQEVFK